MISVTPKYEVIFAHPGAFITCKQRIELFQAEKFEDEINNGILAEQVIKYN